MGRAERRRLEKQKGKQVKTYNLTRSQLHNAVRQVTEEDLKRIKQEAMEDAINTAMTLLLHISQLGLNCLREIQDKYLASSGENCVLMVYNMGESTAKKLWAKDIYSSAYSREVIARAQELRQELTQE